MSKTERLIYLLVSVFGYFVISFLYLGILGNILKDTPPKLLSNLHVISFLLILWFYIRFIHRVINQIGWKDYFSFQLIDIIKFGFGMALILLISLLSAFVGFLFRPDGEFLLGSHEYDVLLIANSISIAFAEELLFRALIFFSLAKITNRIFLSAVLSSLFFALVHIGSVDKSLMFISLLNIFSGGLVLSYLYHLSGSIWTAIGFHGMNNILAFAPDFYKQSSHVDGTTHLLAHSVILLVVGAVLIYIGQRKSEVLS